MLKVLKFVHENGSIHRDIKPSNIMRDRNGRLYLLDFGAVKQQAIGSPSSGKSTGIYSMGFAPPEQMAGSQVYPSTDLYALATTCLNLLTGKKPEELYDSYHHGWNWRTHAPQVSDSLAAILDRMLLPTPKDRFQSAQDVLNALERPQSVTKTQLQPSPANPTAAALSTRKPFSLLEVLGSAAFMGFEGALSYIAFTSLLPFPGIALGLWGMCLGGLIYTLYRRGIEGKDLPILAVLTFLLMSIPALRGGLAISVVAIIAVLGGATAIAITAIFRLIYLILSRFF